MLFKKDDLRELAIEEAGEGFDNFLVMENERVGESRWSNHYRQVFQHTDEQGVARFYETSYSSGKSETQDEYPYDYEQDEIECEEVFPLTYTVTETITEYCTKEQLEKKEGKSEQTS